MTILSLLKLMIFSIFATIITSREIKISKSPAYGLYYSSKVHHSRSIASGIKFTWVRPVTKPWVKVAESATNTQITTPHWLLNPRPAEELRLRTPTVATQLLLILFRFRRSESRRHVCSASKETQRRGKLYFACVHREHVLRTVYASEYNCCMRTLTVLRLSMQVCLAASYIMTRAVGTPRPDPPGRMTRRAELSQPTARNPR